jgi:hypothetical protein
VNYLREYRAQVMKTQYSYDRNKSNNGGRISSREHMRLIQENKLLQKQN